MTGKRIQKTSTMIRQWVTSVSVNCTCLNFCSAATDNNEVGAQTAKRLGPASQWLCLNSHRAVPGCPDQGSAAEVFLLAHVPLGSSWEKSKGTWWGSEIKEVQGVEWKIQPVCMKKRAEMKLYIPSKFISRIAKVYLSLSVCIICCQTHRSNLLFAFELKDILFLECLLWKREAGVKNNLFWQ